MSDPCQQEATIEDLQRAVERSSVIMEQLMTVVSDVRTILLDTTSIKIQQQTIERDLQHAYDAIREQKVDIRVLADWKQRVDGGLIATRIVPVICSILACVAAVVAVVN